MTTEKTRPAGGAQHWGTPALGVVAGVVYFAIFIAWGKVGMALFGVAVMWIYAAVLVLGSRRSETVAMMRGEVTDERRTQISLRASSFALNVLVVAMVGGLLVELGRGHDGRPWTWLAALFAVSYGGATAYYAHRG
ncbi:DUF2178 domain-containing protein [Actinomadura logoneensis]|uniref:DUF2178 domain-containing protein n=1 Tax=Actinomadura logoneensis TaxID=2293572 RepID=A0A372JM00_9ACTN|nr:DUF2178 domain-containing protein [Actinomadura logoneensis]RFU41047.1 DUF2178 domain-containing protein [Actinomadura logoneensis]